jgi:hypothetical protein
MTSQFSPNTVAPVRNLFGRIFDMLGLSYDFQKSPGLRVTIDCRDGNGVAVDVAQYENGPPFRTMRLAPETLAIPDLKVDPTSARGTLVLGTKDIALASAATDRLCVVRSASRGTEGELSVVRKDATTVTVNAWVGGTGIEVLDLSDVTVYNFGAA